MTARQRAMYAFSYTLGLFALALLWAAFLAGGPLPRRHPLTLIANTARAHAYGDIPHA